MSFPRLALLAFALPLLAGGCAGAAVTAASYGADSVSYLETGKGTSDHFASMVSKKDCAFWRMFRNQKICREREGDKDPYKVDYESAQRQQSEDGVAYAPPLRPAENAPATSWTAEAYKPAPAPVAPAAESQTTVVAEAVTPPPPAPVPKSTVHKAAKKKPKAHAKAVRKASPHQVASAL